jgi:alkyl hydroperoxide reductase subunit AhpF
VAAGKDGTRPYRDALQRACSPVLLRIVKDAAAALPADVEMLFFGSDDFPSTSLDTLQLCQFLAESGRRIGLSVHDSKNDRALCQELDVLFFPSIVIRGKNRGRLRFLGTPAGYGLQIIVESLAAASTGEAGLPAGVLSRLSSVKSQVELKVFIRPDSESCRRAALLAMRLAVTNGLVRTEVINHLDFPVMSRKYKVGAVPRTVVNERTEISGARGGEDFMERVLGALVAQPDIYR